MNSPEFDNSVGTELYKAEQRVSHQPQLRDVDEMSMEFGDGDGSQRDSEENGEVNLTESEEEDKVKVYSAV